ncbi:MAG TPA: hypothetical protein VFS67_09700 [Polyangiaceae bacterium]|nr:hypothetical protein [Polyangiaceae bacterium]
MTVRARALPTPPLPLLSLLGGACSASSHASSAQSAPEAPRLPEGVIRVTYLERQEALKLAEEALIASAGLEPLLPAQARR